MIVGDTRHDVSVEDEYGEMLEQQEVDGLLILGHRLPAGVARLLAQRGAKPPIPVVNGCEHVAGVAISSVRIDNVAAGGDGVRHLLALGHRRIGIVAGPLSNPLGRERLKGACAAVAASGTGGVLDVVTGDFSAACGADQTPRLLRRGNIAIFCFSDDIAAGALHGVRRAGLSCPRDVFVLGFDGLDIASHLAPSLTTIAQPSAEIGREAVLLLVRIATGECADIREVTLKHHLILRESTGQCRDSQRHSTKIGG